MTLRGLDTRDIQFHALRPALTLNMTHAREELFPVSRDAVPSFLPFGSSNSMPIQMPSANFVAPTKRTTPASGLLGFQTTVRFRV